jgi:hypothetical protein
MKSAHSTDENVPFVAVVDKSWLRASTNGLEAPAISVAHLTIRPAAQEDHGMSFAKDCATSRRDP